MAFAAVQLMRDEDVQVVIDRGLPDGDVLVAFWCIEDCQSMIRLARLRVA